MSTKRSARRGFTLIELMIAVIIVGFLAMIAIPRFQATRERAFQASMKADLKNLASQQELFHKDAQYYADDLGDFGGETSDGVTVTINEATNVGWSATAVHEGLPDEKCGIYQGKADPAGGDPATGPGVVTCTF